MNEIRTIKIVRDLIDLKDRDATLFRKRIVLAENDISDGAALNVDVLDGNEINIGIITLPSFYIDFDKRGQENGKFKSASQDVLNLLDDVRESVISGIIVDLRSNRGGSLDEAVKLAGLFIDRGPIVQVKYASGRKKVLADTDNSTYSVVPVLPSNLISSY